MSAMRIALVTTTINRPGFLLDWAQAVRNARVTTAGVVIAGDQKTEEHEIDSVLCDDHVVEAFTSTIYLGPDDQERLYPEVSRLIGWNCIQRRNIAMLEALHSGAEWLLLLDDDNYPHYTGAGEENTFGLIARIAAGLTLPRREVRDAAVLPPGSGGRSVPVYNTGELGGHAYYARGYPFSLRTYPEQWGKKDFGSSITQSNPDTPGLVQGAIFEHPDINAIDALMGSTFVARYAADVAMEPVIIRAYTPVNTQATLVHRDYVSAMLLDPGFRRYDDIIAGYIAHRVVQKGGRVTCYGGFATRHKRNPHDVLRDLEEEVWGMRYIEEILHRINSPTLIHESPKESAELIWRQLNEAGFGDAALRRAWFRVINEIEKERKA